MAVLRVGMGGAGRPRVGRVRLSAFAFEEWGR